MKITFKVTFIQKFSNLYFNSATKQAFPLLKLIVYPQLTIQKVSLEQAIAPKAIIINITSDILKKVSHTL